MRSNPVLAIVLASLALAACDKTESPRAPEKANPVPTVAPTTPAAAPVAADAPSPPTPTKFRPISFFQEKCARCHGPYGTFYGEGFAARLNDDQLRAKVHDMVFGAGRSTLPDADIDLLTAFQRSIRSKSPFLLVGTDEPDWGGEVSPGAVVEINTGTQKIAATVDSHLWQAPKSATSSTPTITATLNGVQTTIPLVSGEVSHRHTSSQAAR